MEWRFVFCMDQTVPQQSQDQRRYLLEEDLILLRHRFHDAQPSEAYYHQRYARIIAYSIVNYAYEMSPQLARQLLADYFKLDIDHPSKTHTDILRAALVLQRATHDFHFVPFLLLWNLDNLRESDFTPHFTSEGDIIPSMSMRIAHAYAHSLLLRPDEQLPESQLRHIFPDLRSHGLGISTFVVTNLRTDRGNPQRTLATLVDSQGREFSLSTEYLTLHPLIAKSGQTHQVRIGELYDCVFRFRDVKPSAMYDNRGNVKPKSLMLDYGYLSTKSIADVFATTVGYVQYIDLAHGHIHVYDSSSRHFVARMDGIDCAAGDFFVFVPVVPLQNRFKSAILLRRLQYEQGAEAFGQRQIQITNIDSERNQARWILLDPANPIVEAGTSSPAFVDGVLWLDQFEQQGLNIPSVGAIYAAVVFLKRGKDGRKYPFLASLIAQKSISS